MKTYKLTLLVAVIAFLLFLIVPNLSWAAEDGAALYKAKCSACHGVNGEGKPAMKAPALKGDATVSPEFLLKGAADKKAPHTKGVVGVNEAQAKAIVEHVKGLK